MIFNSIKWRLQLWYGLILLLVLAGFGITAYQMERGRLIGYINGELQRRIGILAEALRRPPLRGDNEGHFDRPPEEQDSRPQPSEFHLPPQRSDLFDAGSPNHFYFIINASDGRQIAGSTNVPAASPSDLWVDARSFTGDARGSNIKPGSPFLQPLRKYQELVQTLPRGEQIIVGCSTAPEIKQLHHTALMLLGFGGVILILGLAGGGWFISRAIRPIEQISSTAVKISAGDLSQRINVAETESELGKLAAVLNSTFARLESSFAQQKQFASDAAHELRTPVTVLLTQTQTALNREREAKDYRETIEVCQRAAQRMKKLIAALLELTRLDAGQEHVKRKRLNLTQTVHDGVELIRPITEEHGLKLAVELSPVEITGDAGRLSQVVTNLLTNAIQYNKPHGEIRVKLEAQNGLAVLTVADTGRGIAPADLPHVFKRFYRGDKSRTGASNAGLGLAICKAIVEAHGGTIEAASQEEIGTTFTVRLPV